MQPQVRAKPSAEPSASGREWAQASGQKAGRELVVGCGSWRLWQLEVYAWQEEKGLGGQNLGSRAQSMSSAPLQEEGLRHPHPT